MSETDTLQVISKGKNKGTFPIVSDTSQQNKTGTHPVTAKPATAKGITATSTPQTAQNNHPDMLQPDSLTQISPFPPAPTPEEARLANQKSAFATAIYDMVNTGILSISELGGHYRPQNEKDVILEIIRMGISYDPVTKLLTYDPPEEEPSAWDEFKKKMVEQVLEHGTAPGMSLFGSVLGTVSKDFQRTAERSISSNLLNRRPDKVLRNPEVIKKMLRTSKITGEASEILETSGEFLETLGRRLTAFQLAWAIISADSPESRDIEKVEERAIVALRRLGRKTGDTTTFPMAIK